MAVAVNKSAIRRLLQRSVITSDADSCWVWTGRTVGRGYGQMKVRREQVLTHRLSWILHFGQILEGLCVCHRCDNPRCVRPSHLFLGTTQDNLDDMVAKGRSTAGRKRPGTGPAGTRNCKAKLTPEVVAQIREDYRLKRGNTRTLALKYRISKSQVHNIVSGGQWREPNV